MALPVAAQKIAILTPDKTESSREFAEKLGERLSEHLNVLDFALAESAYASGAPATPFNLTAEESKRLGAAIGCDFFVMVRSTTQRRSSFEKAEYYESYAVIYLVSARTGQLVLWEIPRYEAAKPDAAADMLAGSVAGIAARLRDSLRAAAKDEIEVRDSAFIEEIPEENSPAAKNFRAPVPYRRLKPEYTAEAFFYDVTATVDILVDLGASGIILRTRVVRWAGYGLDQSVERAVRTMNWRPAMRDGKPLPMRFLLRYNFKKLEKE